MGRAGPGGGGVSGGLSAGSNPPSRVWQPNTGLLKPVSDSTESSSPIVEAGNFSQCKGTMDPSHRETSSSFSVPIGHSCGHFSATVPLDSWKHRIGLKVALEKLLLVSFRTLQ